MDKNRLVRFLCIAVVSVALMLALILTVTVFAGMAGQGTPEETTYEGFRPSFPDGSFNWEDYFSSFEPPELPTRDPWDTVEPPDGTLPWDDLEWPTLPPSDDPLPDPEWPTLPEEWDTLPEEWGTLPEDWDIPTDPSVLDDLLAGLDGSLGLPPGALGAGVASQLTVLNVFAERDDRLYLKTKAFGDYNGQGWSEAVAYGTPYRSVYSADYLPYMLGSGRANESLILISPVMKVRVLPYYVTTYYSSLEHVQKTDVTVTAGNDQPYALYYSSFEDPRAFVGVHDEALLDYENAYAKWARTRYTTVDGETYDYMTRIIEREGFDRSDPEIVDKVAAYIRNAASYNLLYDRKMDEEANVALAFLGGYREGVCRHFATAATLLYRSLGIPARYVVGFAADVTAGDITAIKGADAHAWVEVYVEGFGWRYVEVTGSPAARPPEPGIGTQPPVEPDGIPVTLRPVDLALQYTGETVVHNGKLTGFAEYEAKGYTYEAMVNGYLQRCGSCLAYLEDVRIYDPDGVDVTADFAITKGTGTLTAYMYEVYYTSVSANKVYDGKALMTQRVSLTGGSLPAGYSVEMVPKGGQTAVGRGYAAFDLIFRFDDGSGKLVDRTHYFLVHKRYGTLSVTPASLTVKAADAQKVYDGKPLTAPDIAIIEGALAEGDYIRSFKVEGTQTRVGRSDNVITDIVIRNAKGEDVTGSYNVVTVAGTLKVTSS